MFQNILKLDEKSLTRDDCWPENGCSVLKDLEIEGERVLGLYNVELNEVREFLKRSRRTMASLVEAIPCLAAQKANKSRWVEKTPSHLLHVHAIRRLFPDATVVRIVRDPRAVALSLSGVPWASNSILANCYRCLRDYNLTHSFFDEDRDSITVTFESLISSPRETLKKICAAVGEPFEEAMINTDSDVSQLTTQNETWKQNIGKELDSTRINSWEHEMPSDLKDACSLVCRDILNEFNYECTNRETTDVYLYPWSHSWTEKNEKLMVKLLNQGIRLIPVCDLEIVAIIKDPERALAISNPARFLWRMIRSRRILFAMMKRHTGKRSKHKLVVLTDVGGEDTSTFLHRPALFLSKLVFRCSKLGEIPTTREIRK